MDGCSSKAGVCQKVLNNNQSRLKTNTQLPISCGNCCLGRWKILPATGVHHLSTIGRSGDVRRRASVLLPSTPSSVVPFLIGYWKQEVAARPSFAVPRLSSSEGLFLEQQRDAWPAEVCVMVRSGSRLGGWRASVSRCPHTGATASVFALA